MRDIPLLLLALSALVLAATWIGYPAWLELRARALPRRRLGGRLVAWPTVTIVVVVRNAEPTLRQLLNNLLALAYPADLRRILVVSDASDDFTDAVAGSLAHRGVELLRVMRRRGEAGALNLARAYVDSDVVVVVEPGVRLTTSALAALVGPFADLSVGVSYGHEIETMHETAFGRHEARLRDLETQVFSTVSARGSLYAMRGPLFRFAIPSWLSPDFALALLAREHGYRAVYVDGAECVVAAPAAFAPSHYARLVRSVARDVATLLLKPHLLDPRRYGEFAWELLGHKLGRWLTPWALLTAALSLLLAAATHPWARIVVLALAVLAAADALAALLPRHLALARLAELPRHAGMFLIAMAHACVRAARTAAEFRSGALGYTDLLAPPGALEQGTA